MISAINIAMEDLLHEAGDGVGRIELAIPPGMVAFLTNTMDGTAVKKAKRVILDPLKRTGDSSHPTSTSAQSSRGLLLVGDFSTTILTGGCVLRQPGM